MPLLSIIIPVFNVAPYLRECLDSVLSQTFTRWEAICVDDGSVDESGSILDEYSERDSRIKVVHQANSGVSFARNVALKIMQGEWFFFLDADDLLHPNMLEQVALQMGEDIDVVFAGYQSITTVSDFKFKIEGKTASKKELSRIDWDTYFHPIFAAAFRSAKFSHLRFNKSLSIGEDRLWFVTALESMSKAAIIGFQGYGYRIRGNSATKSAMTEKKFSDEICHFIQILSILASSSKLFEKRILRRIGQSLTEYAAASFIKLQKMDRPRCLKVWREAMKTASGVLIVPLPQRLVMMASVVTRCSPLILLFCYVPYWLKMHGLHR